MPYLGREPQGILANTIEGNLKVTGTISADSINDKLALNGSDTSSPQSNANDQIVLEAGTLDDATHSSVVPAMVATDNLLLEDVTPSQVEVPLASISAAGTSGQFLQSQGSLVAPTFAAVSSPGLNFISKTTISSSVSESIVNFDSTAYSNYVIWIRELHGVSDGDVRIRWSNDNGTTFTNQNYGYVLNGGRNGANADYGMSPNDHGLLADDAWNNAGSRFNATINLTVKSGSGQDEVAMWYSAAYTDAAYGSLAQSYTAGAIHVVAPGYTTAFEISNAGGNIDGGIIVLYGLTES